MRKICVLSAIGIPQEWRLRGSVSADADGKRGIEMKQNLARSVCTLAMVKGTPTIRSELHALHQRLSARDITSSRVQNEI